MSDAVTGRPTISAVPGEDPSAVQAALARLRDGGVRTVILGGADTHGIMRGKRVPIDRLQHLLEHGMAMCDVFWVIHIDESDLVARPHYHTGYFPSERDGYPDITAVPDVSTLRLVPWHEATALLLCDFHRQDGGAIPISPRTVLRRVIERSRELGLEPMCGIELEFYVLRETPVSVLTRRPAELEPLEERPSTYGVTMGSRQEPLSRLIRESALAYGLPIEACNPETGPGQFEITLHYAPALKAADDAFLFRAAVKELARQQGLMATFMAETPVGLGGQLVPRAHQSRGRQRSERVLRCRRRTRDLPRHAPLRRRHAGDDERADRDHGSDDQLLPTVHAVFVGGNDSDMGTGQPFHRAAGGV